MTARPLALALSLSALLAACGGSDDGVPGGARAPSTPEGLGRLVPADSTVFVQLGSVQAVEELVASLGLDDGFHFDPADVLGTVGVVGVDGARIARDRPWGVALALDPAAPLPAMTVVLPVDDADLFLAGWQAQPGQTAARADGYVGLSTVEGYAAGAAPPELAALPTHVFAMHADLEAIVAAMRPLIEMGLAQAEELMAQSAATGAPGMQATPEMTGVGLDFVRSMLDSADALELSLAVDGPMLALDGTLAVLPGSALDGFADGREPQVGALAAALDPEAPISFAACGDMPRLMDLLLPMYETLLAAYPEPLRGQMSSTMELFRGTYPLLGQAMAGSVRFGGQGMSMAFAMDSPDPEALQAKYLEAIAAMPPDGAPWRSGAVERVELGGREVTRFAIEVDVEELAALYAVEGQTAEGAAELQRMVEQMLGPDGTHVYMSTAGGRFGMVMGADEGVAAAGLDRVAASARELPAPMAFAFARCAGTSPFMVYSVDVPRLLGELQGMLPGMPDELPAGLGGQSVPAVFYGGAREHAWRGGLALAPADLARLVEAARPR